MTDHKPVRIDKFLWAARIFKTRSMASDQCRKGRITVNNTPAKPSRTVETDDIITVRKPPAVFTYRVMEPTEKRVSARLVTQIIEDITSEEEKAKLDHRRTTTIVFREKGTGRPTKKERRLIDRISDDLNYWKEGGIKT
jgi:ribosome-associated heat shock protein Hsp15